MDKANKIHGSLSLSVKIPHSAVQAFLQHLHSQCGSLVVWRSSNVLCPISLVTLCLARLVPVCGQVNHLGT